MRIALILISLAILTACSDDALLAKQYKLELSYYENSVRFTNLSMVDEAYMSCKQTELLRNECFTSLVQTLMARDMQPAKEFCDEINPNYKMPMTIGAFMYVYGEIDPVLMKELKEKMNPSKERKAILNTIKQNCYTK